MSLPAKTKRLRICPDALPPDRRPVLPKPPQARSRPAGLPPVYTKKVSKLPRLQRTRVHHRASRSHHFDPLNLDAIQTSFKAYIEQDCPDKSLLYSIKSGYEAVISSLLEQNGSPKSTANTSRSSESELEAAHQEIARLRQREQQLAEVVEQLQRTSSSVTEPPQRVPALRLPAKSADFQDEFMMHLPEFSESWRAQLQRDHH